MSQDVTKQKRERIATKTKEVETAKTTKQEDYLVNANVPLEEFDWELHESTCPSVSRKPNPNIKTRKGHRVFSRELYAQEFYDLMEEYDSGRTTLFKLNEGETHEGTVDSINTEWATIDIGYKEMVYVDLSRESDVSKAKMVPGEGISVQITGDTNNRKSTYVKGSVEAGVKAATLREIFASIEEGNTAYVGNVKSMIPGGGYMVEIQGVECFMPGSLAGINKLVDFESIIGEDMYVVPTNYSKDRGTIIVSHRKYLQAMIPHKLEELKEDLTKQKTGNVTGSAKYGVFVEFDGCLTGMIHVNDLNPEMLKRHLSRDIQPGEAIEFKVKEVISQRKITLTQLEVVDVVDPWKSIAKEFTKFPTEVVGTVKSVKDYGVFVDVYDGIVGLLHISEFPEGVDTSSMKKEDKVTVQIQRIEEETRKVFLKL